MKTPRKPLSVGLTLLLTIFVSGCSGNIDAARNTTLAAPTTPLSAQVDPSPSFQDAAGEITANGIVVPARQVSLGFQVGGVVKELAVEVGDTVQVGQLLAQLDKTPLERAVAQAEIDLALVRAQLTQLRARPSKEAVSAAEGDIAAAEADLASARANLTTMQAALAEAQRRLADAEDTYRRALDRPWEPQEVRDAAQREVTRAQENLDVAKANRSAAQARVQAAQAEIEHATAQRDEIMAGATAEEIAAAQARLDQAQLTLDQARADLASTDLVAPFTGTVTALMLHEGEVASIGSTALQLADTSHWRVETNNVGELQIGKVKIGQEAHTIVNAFLDKELTGTVIAISPIAIVQYGDTTYTVTVELAETDLNLKWGMTARVRIVVEN